MDRYTAYDDPSALGFQLPAAAQQWAQRPPATPRCRADRADPGEELWIMVDGRSFFGGARQSGG